MTPKNLALLFPDWNSLDSVRNAHSLLELWAIWLFAALVLCDIVAHLIEEHRKPLAKIFERIGLCCFALAVAAELSAYKYGQRNDELSAGVIKSLSAEAEEAAAKAAKAITDSGIALNQSGVAETKSGDAQNKVKAVGQEADQANARAAELERANIALKAKMAPRRVTGEQAKTLCSGVHVTGKPSLEMESSFGTTEPDDFADDIGRALAGCEFGFSVRLTPSVRIFPVPNPFRIGYAPARKQDAEMISTAMVAAKIATKPIELKLVPDADKYPNALRLFVGPKPPNP